jgi:hypothetical protein
MRGGDDQHWGLADWRRGRGGMEMPYIAQGSRSLYDRALARLAESINDATPAGDLNYIITRISADWLQKRGLSYSALADVVAVLETAKLEFYRRIAGPYEDGKAALNGDVYGELGEG